MQKNWTASDQKLDGGKAWEPGNTDVQCAPPHSQKRLKSTASNQKLDVSDQKLDGGKAWERGYWLARASFSLF